MDLRVFKLRFLDWALALWVLGISPASAQQVFVNNVWVAHPRVCSGPDIRNHYQCSGPPDSSNPNAPVFINGVLCGGNISNDPRIEFENGYDPATNTIYFSSAPPQCDPPPSGSIPLEQLPFGDAHLNICNAKVFLCCKVGWSNTQSGNSTFGIDFISLEVFKFQQGSNPLDPASTPPIRTYFIDDPGIVPAASTSDECVSINTGALCAPIPTGCPATCRRRNELNVPPGCVPWDGSFNIQGEFGRSNGQYGFRCTVATNQTGVSGNINITQTRAYPAGPTLNRFATCGGGSIPEAARVEQKPITVDVVNVHVVRTSPTVVGEITGVAAEPYNINYRLSKDATTFVEVYNTAGSPFNPVPPNSLVRTIVPGLPRAGEGVPSGTLQNGDGWNGRFNNGDLAPPGAYLARILAYAGDQFGNDISNPAFRQISLDPLQITDIRVQPLTDSSTSLAVLTYVLTEPATVYIDIYPPGTQFLNGLNSVNNPAVIPDLNPNTNEGVPKDFRPFLNSAAAPLVRRIQEYKDFRRPVINFWDGRDKNDNVLPDGDYVFVIYAHLSSQNGIPFLGSNNDKRVWSSNAKSGFIPIIRGFVTISQVNPASTVIGSSPAVAGLDPFTFSYSLSREAKVTLKILDNTGRRTVRTLVNNETRPGGFLNRERWIIPVDDSGLFISSGIYLVQLSAADPFFPPKVTTTTASFPINLFRITDVFTTPLLTGATDVITLSYQLSQSMRVAWNIYPPGTVISGSSATWPPCSSIEPGLCSQVTGPTGSPVAPLITIKGTRPGRLRITEFWDGRDPNGLFVPDGTYIFTLTAQSTTTPRYFATDQIFGTLTIARGAVIFPAFNVVPTVPRLFFSSQTITLHPFEVDYSLTRQSSVTIQILTTNIPIRVIRTLISGQVRDSNILNREFWDARDDSGNFVSPGFYTLRVLAEDLASILSSGSTAQQTIAVSPLRIYDVAVDALRGDVDDALIAYQVSETMKVSIKIYKPGTTFDSSGNPRTPDAVSLVKRIVGVRPARTSITERWDGTDETLSRVTDGNYIFRIVASTNIQAIDTITGNVLPGASLAQDLIIAEIPVTRGGSLNPLADFEKNSFIFPNPARGPSANFQIYVPFQANVNMKIYNIAGELVFERSFGNQAADTYINFNWDKTNQSGRSVAHGVYFALIREDTTRGEKVPFQTVKKFLIP